MPKILRRSLIVFTVLVFLMLLVFSAALVVIYQKQGAVVQKALAEFNQRIPGKITLEYSRISPFENFPYVSIDLHGLKVYESDDHVEPFLDLEDVYVGFDVVKLLQGEFQVAKIKLVSGFINVKLYADTTYNLLRAFEMPESEREDPSSDPEAFALELKSLVLKNVSIAKYSELDSSRYALQFRSMQFGFNKNNHEILARLKGDLLLSARMKDSTLAENKPIFLRTALAYEKEPQRLLMEDSELYVKGVLFGFSGKIDIANDLDLDINIRGEKDDFGLIFALLPDDLDEFVQRYRNAGKIFFEADIKGKSSKGHTPFIEARFGCSDGFFHNIGRNRKLDGLGFSGYFTNGEGRSLTTSEFRLLDFNAIPEQGVVKANLILRNLVDPYVDLKVYTDFDLQFLADFFQISSLQNLRGNVFIDVSYDELVDISKPETVLEGVQQGIDSRIQVRNLEFNVPDSPWSVKDLNLSASMKYSRLQLDTFRVKVGESDLRLSGYISDLPSILHKQDSPVDVGLRIESDLIDLLALTSKDTLTRKPVNEQVKGLRSSVVLRGVARDLIEFEYLPKGEFRMNEFYAAFSTYPHIFHDFDLHLSIDEHSIAVKHWRGGIDSTDFSLDVTVANYPKWFRDTTDGQSSIRFAIQSNYFRPKDVLGPKAYQLLPADYLEEDIRRLRLRGQINLAYRQGTLSSTELNIERAGAQLTLHPLKLEDIRGSIRSSDGILQTENFHIWMGASDLKLNMTYHTDEKWKGRQNEFFITSNKLDFDELSNYEKAFAQNEDSIEVHANAFNIFDLPFSNMKIGLSVGKLKFHKIWIDNLESRIRITENHMLHVDKLKMDIAGGHVDLKGYLNGSDPKNLYWHPQLRVINIDLDKILIKVDNFGQEMLVNENIKGRLTGGIDGKIKIYPDLFPILNESELSLDLMITDGVLVNFGPMRALSDFFRDRNLSYVRFDTLRNTFRLKDNLLTVPAMTINSSLGFIEVSGRQSLDMNMNYFVRVPWSLVTNVGVQRLFGRRNREEVPADQIDEIVIRDTGRRVRFLNVQISGTPDNYRVSLGRDRNPT
jgi:hypothetical protein